MSIISFSKHLQTRYPYDEQLFSPSIIVVEMLYTPTYRLAYHLAYITFVNLKRKRNIFALLISFCFFFCLTTCNTFYVVQFLGPYKSGSFIVIAWSTQNNYYKRAGLGGSMELYQLNWH